MAIYSNNSVPEFPSVKWPIERNRLTIALVAIVLVIISLISYLIVHSKQHRKAGAASSAITYSDPQGLFSLLLPTSWQLQTNLATPPNLLEQVAFAPKDAVTAYRQAHKNDFLEFVIIQVIQTDTDPTIWFKAQGLGTPVASSTIPISGSSTFAAKTIGPTGMDDHYVVSHGGKLVHLLFHQQVTAAGVPKVDNSKYLSDFDHIATSLKFKR